jgi:hypothetical protein
MIMDDNGWMNNKTFFPLGFSSLANHKWLGEILFSLPTNNPLAVPVCTNHLHEYICIGATYYPSYLLRSPTIVYNIV